MLKISSFTGGIAQTNGYLVETDQGNLIVDAPEGMAEWLAAQGKPVSALFLTHQHFDHCQDAAAVQKKYGLKIYSYAPFSRQLTLEFLMGFTTGTRFEIAAFNVDEILEGKSNVDVCGISWHLEHIPGHSLDSVTFYSKEDKTLFGGDVLFLDSVGRADFPGGSMTLLLEGIREKVLNLPDDTRVIPGHGPATTVGREREENAYLE